MNAASKRLASRTSVRQGALLARADRAADRAESAVRLAWTQLTALLRRRPHPWEVHRELQPALRALSDGVRATLSGELSALAITGHRMTAAELTRTMPVRYLARAAARKESVRRLLPLPEARKPKPPLTAPVPGHGDVVFVPDPVARPQNNVTILVDPAKLDADWAADPDYIPPGGGGAEIAGRRKDFENFLAKREPVEASRLTLGDDGRPSFINGRHRYSVLRDKGARLVAITVPRHQAADFLARYGPDTPPPPPSPPGAGSAAPAPGPPQPGLVSLGIGPDGLRTEDLMARLREPDISNDEGRELLGQLLFPPLKLEDVTSILRQPILGRTWEQDWSIASKLADPNVIMGVVAGGLAAGQNPREIARTLQPIVQGVQASARRVARTYGMQVAHHAQMEAHAQLGDLIIGWQVHSAKSPNSRDWHVERDGTIYYLNPTGDQKGMAQCPHPPLEPDDPRERPPNTPHMAWNCLCWLSPVLRED